MSRNANSLPFNDSPAQKGEFSLFPEKKDHFVERNGIRFAGTHLIVDLYEAKNLDNLPFIEKTLIRCVEVARATLLHIHLHRFEPNGISGVAVLAESHISLHSWPEYGYVALDIFMCGEARPHACIDILTEAFACRRKSVQEIFRGRSLQGCTPGF